METITIARIVWMSVTSFFVLGLVGCTFTMDVPQVAFADYPQSEKINLRVGLRLSEELRNAKSERSEGWDTSVMPLGENLILNSESVARAVFSSVFVTNTATSEEIVDISLVPRMITSRRNKPNWSDGWKIAIILEWVLIDKKGETIWADTITAEGRISLTDLNPTENRRRIMESVLRDLFLKSHKAMLQSPEIKDFANRYEKEQQHRKTNG